MKKKPCILVVEDEAAIRTGLIDVLVFHGFDAEGTENGRDGLAKALTGQYDLILLDVMLPGMNGFDVCDEIRSHDRAQPIIMLTAKNSEDDIIQGLSLGADDYVGKPFSVAQLVLRVQAVLRRSRVGVELASHIYFSDGLTIDTENLCGARGEEAMLFTRREMDMLQYFHANSERPVPRDELLTRVWGYARDLDLETRTVDIHIAKLRRKIEIHPAEPQNLLTVRGAGYRLLSES